jgi:glycosyltransferase involved in cell wall biosynthesis
VIALVIVGNGRLDYLTRTMAAAEQHLPPVDHRILIDDSGDPDVIARLQSDEFAGWMRVVHPTNLGMAAAVNTAAHTSHLHIDHLVYLEDDMELISPLPIHRACEILDDDKTIAQVLFSRQPLHPLEEDGGVLGGLVKQATEWETHADYTTHDTLFSLNPCVIPRRVFGMEWPSGPIGVGNETGMTRKLLGLGYRFAAWGTPGNCPQLVHHIGELRGAAWQL